MQRDCDLKPGLTLAALNDSLESLGKEFVFADLDYSVQDGARATYSGMDIIAIVAKNDSGGALLPSTVVKFDTGAGDRPVNVINEADATDMPDGVVDPFLPAAGVATGSYFLLFREGPCKLITDGNAAVVVGETFATIGTGTGKVRKKTTLAFDHVGVALEAAAATDALTFRAYIKCRR